MGEELVYEVGIGLLPGIGNYLTRTLISYCGSAKQGWHAPPGKIEKIPGIGPMARNILGFNSTAAVAGFSGELQFHKKNPSRKNVTCIL